MSIKRLRVNEEGKHEERELECSELPPPPSRPLPRERASPRRSRPLDDEPGQPMGPVKVTRSAKRVVPAGHTVLDEGVIRYVCNQCEASRIVSQILEKPPECSMCKKPMRLQNR